MITVLWDPGHGINTVGKYSTDKTLYEYEWNREMVKKMDILFKENGIPSIIVTPEITDVSILTRANRVNELCDHYGKDNLILISVHINADGNGTKWTNAHGISSFVYKKDFKDKDGKIIKTEYGSERSQRLGTLFGESCLENHLHLRTPMPNQKFWFENFGILRRTKCPAILTENFFMTNRVDLSFIKSEEGKDIIAKTHLEAVKKYIEYYSK